LPALQAAGKQGRDQHERDEKMCRSTPHVPVPSSFCFWSVPGLTSQSIEIKAITAPEAE
jgi:hypothetical protein